ncbi:MAG: hypothetical protein R3301_13800, partial [Saprospiraceae bacterium]|nr:hypothetical protein [Saprospiraceae bacterium]
ESYRFIQELDVSYLHVFTYSERPNTPAAEMAGVVPVGERRERNAMLRILSDKKKQAFCQQFVGQTRNVLVESSKEPHTLSGFTDNYIKVKLAEDSAPVNAIVAGTLTHLDPETASMGFSVQGTVSN